MVTILVCAGAIALTTLFLMWAVVVFLEEI